MHAKYDKKITTAVPISFFLLSKCIYNIAYWIRSTFKNWKQWKTNTELSVNRWFFKLKCIFIISLTFPFDSRLQLNTAKQVISREVDTIKWKWADVNVFCGEYNVRIDKLDMLVISVPNTVTSPAIQWE